MAVSFCFTYGTVIRPEPVGLAWYLLVREDEDGAERLWGRCAGVEGLFVDPVPPPREVLTFRGCRPDGLLKDVLAGPGVSLRGPGRRVRRGPQRRAARAVVTLVDAVVPAHRPHPADPARYDVVFGAGVRSEGSGVALPAAPRFELFAGPVSTTNAGRCAAVDSLFKARADPAPVPMELVGCEPAEPLLAVLRHPGRSERDRARLLVLDRHGAWEDPQGRLSYVEEIVRLLERRGVTVVLR
ncbi:hypothetical protein ACFV0O_01770 [Kitasatospora sp. NPDC059577]|uniref:hypothetical protein n=2 Tax=unclassified Kitasatospora TaxID=2633591 RepID=UPI0036A11206